MCGVASAMPPTSGQQLYYPFTGNANDASGNGRNGTLVGSPSLTNDIDNVAGRAYTLNGSSQYIDTPWSQSGVSAYTISAWFKTTSTGTNQTIVQNRGTGPGRSLTVTLNSFGTGAGRVNFVVDSDGIAIGVNSNAAYNDGNWHHVVAVWTGGGAVTPSQFKLYIDNIPVGTSDVSTGSAPSAPLSGEGTTKIGWHQTWGSYFQGSIDEVIIYNRALSALEIAELFELCQPMNLLLYYPLNGNANDASGNRRDGTLMSGPTLTADHNGLANRAYSFSGTQYVDTAYTQSGVSAYSVSAWIRTTSASAGLSIVQCRGADNGRSLTFGVNDYQANGGYLCFGLDSSGVYVGKRSTVLVNDGNWHHVVGVWSGGGRIAPGQFTLYVDNAASGADLTNNADVSAPFSGEGYTKIGYHQAWNTYFPGSIDEVKIFDRALTAAEVARLYADTPISLTPTVLSVTRTGAQTVPTAATTADYSVLFTQAVQTLVAGDFMVSFLGGSPVASISAVAANPTVYLNTDFASQPAGTTLLGGAAVTGGYLDLSNAANQNRGLAWNPGAALVTQAFRADFDVYLDGGTGADGIAFAYGANAGALFTEEGPSGNGLTVSIDTYDNGSEDAPPNIGIECNGVMVGAYKASAAMAGSYFKRILRTTGWTSPANWAHVTIDVTYTGSIYLCSVAYNGAWTTNKVILTGYAPAAGWQFGLCGRTRTAWDNQRVDNLVIRGSERIVTLGGLGGNGTLRLDYNDANSTVKNFDNTTVSPLTHTGEDTYILDHTEPAAPSGLDLAANDDTGSSSTDNITSQTTALTIKGTGAETGSLVTIKDNGTAIATGPAADFNAATGIDISLAEGTHSITATATDAAGNVSADSAALSITVDTTRPAVTFNAPTGGPINSSGTAVFPVTISGANTINLAAGNVTINRTGATGGGAAVLNGTTSAPSVQVTGVSGDGSITISIAAGIASDTAGNTSLAVGPSASVSVDNTAPTKPNVMGVTPTNDQTPTWSWTPGGDGNGTYRWDLDNTGSWTQIAATAYTPAGNLSPGSHRLTVQERDDAGNWSIDSFFDIFIDITPPGPPDVNGTTPTNDQTPAWSWTPGGGGNGTYRWDLDNTGSWTQTTSAAYTPAGNLGEGPHRLVVQERDDAGNWSASGFFDILIDITLPVVNIGAPSGSPVNSAGTASFPVTITGADSISLAMGNVTLNHSGTGGGNITVLNGTTAAPTVQVTGVSGNGSYTISIASGVAADSAGNTSLAAGPSAAINVDNTAPSVTVLSGPSVSAANTGPVTYSVTFNEPVTGFNSAGDIDVQATGTAAPGLVEVAGSGAGAYTVTLSNINGNGSLKIAVKAGAASDAAGNANTVSAASTAFDVDNTLPTVTGITRLTPASALTNASTVTWRVAFNEPVNGLAPADFTATVVSGALPGAGTLAVSTPSGSTVDVTSGPFTGSGELRLDVLGASATITDNVGNALVADYTDGEPYTVDQAGPVIDPLDDRATASLSPAISGTATDNMSGVASINVRVHNGAGYDHSFAASVTPPNGMSCSWTTGVSPALTVGDYTVDVTGTDAAGNAGAAESFTLTVDTNVPTITVIDMMTADSTPTFTGTASTQAPRTIIRVDVTVAGVTRQATLLTSGSSVNWELTIPDNGALEDGIYMVTVEATNNLLLTGDGSFSLMVDSTAPAVAFTPVLTNAANVTLAGTLTEAVAVMSFTVTVGGAGHAVTPVLVSGSEYTWTLDLGAQAEGSYDVAFASVDLLSNGGHWEYPAGLVVDRTAPTGTVTINDGAAYANQPRVSLTLTGADALSGVTQMRFSADGVSWEPADWAAAPAFATDYSNYVLSPGEGERMVYVQLRDAAGNVSTDEISDAITVDQTEPEITGLLAAPNQAKEGDTVQLMFSVSEALQDVPEVTVNGHAAQHVSGKAEDFTYTYAVTDSDPVGPATVTVIAVDVAGNQGVSETEEALEILGGATGVPVAAWPALMLLPAAAAWALRRRNGSRR